MIKDSGSDVIIRLSTWPTVKVVFCPRGQRTQHSVSVTLSQRGRGGGGGGGGE